MEISVQELCEVESIFTKRRIAVVDECLAALMKAPDLLNGIQCKWVEDELEALKRKMTVGGLPVE